MVDEIIDRIRRRDSKSTKFFYNLIHGILRIEVNYPNFICKFLSDSRAIRKTAFHWIRSKFYYEPLFRSRCNRIGKNVRTDGDMPFIIGSGELNVGNNVKVGNRTTFILLPNLYERPELTIGDGTVIGYMTGISVEQKVTIGSNCLIAGDVYITDNNSHGISSENGRKMTKADVSPVIIEDNVWIGTQSIILKGVRIGRGSVVAAGSVVTKSVPENVVVGGNPAKIIKEIPKDVELTTEDLNV